MSCKYLTHSWYVIFKWLYWGIIDTHKKMHIFNVWDLMSLDICYTHEIITTIKIIDNNILIFMITIYTQLDLTENF